MKIYSILFLTLVLLNSCETTEKIDDFPLRPSSLVANCYFTTDSIWEIQVSKSLSVLDNADLKYVSNAEISIFNNDQLLDTINAPDPDGIYRSSAQTPVEDEHYTLEVRSPDFSKPLFATDFLPKKTPILNAAVTIIDSSFYYADYPSPEDQITYGRAKGTISIEFTDPSAEENYYELKIYQKYIYINYDDSTTHSQKIKMHVTSDDPLVEVNNDSYYAAFYFTDEIINGLNYNLKVKFDNWDLSLDTKFEIELTSLSRASYLYRQSVSKYEESSEDPFSEPVTIFNNIENGFGIFAGYSTSTYIIPLIN